MGDMWQVGPGFFPTALGRILAALGVLIALVPAGRTGPAKNSRTTLPAPRAALVACVVLVRSSAFSPCPRSAGLAPAAFACVFVGMLGTAIALREAGAVAAVGRRPGFLVRYVLQIPLSSWLGSIGAAYRCNRTGHGFDGRPSAHNLLWCFVGVLIGNFVGVLPGMGVMAAISILLPLTFGMTPVAAILMLAGIYYGAHMAERSAPYCSPALPSAARGNLFGRLSDDAAGQGRRRARDHGDRVVRRPRRSA